MSGEFKTNIRSKSIWLRGFFMLLFAVLYGVAEIVLVAIAVFQFGHALFTGRRNDNAAGFGYSVGRYIFDITRFVTFNTDERPFPFSPWPDAAPAATEASATEPPVRNAG
jgi:hypothetical protein